MNENEVKKEQYSLEPLMEVMQKLLGENGCPWDKEQTHDSLKRYLIEECYEVIEAIEEKSMYKLREELGDLLLQIVFHAKLAEQEGHFQIEDVVKGIAEKMILRHPHVFGETEVANSEEVLVNWEEIKAKEKKGKNINTLMDVPRGIPSLLRAEKIQKRAAKIGFDWPSIEGPWSKVGEEIDELRVAVHKRDEANIEEELGDIFFALVNISRFLSVDPEEALAKTNEKFIRRFKYMEAKAKERGVFLEDLSLEEMDKLYNEAKL